VESSDLEKELFSQTAEQGDVFLKLLSKEMAGFLVLVGHVHLDSAHLKGIMCSPSVHQGIPSIHNIW
jgi:hypothetical protein